MTPPQRLDQTVPVTNEPRFPGWLTVLEGIDGTGKTTQARLLHETLQARGFDALLSREPTTGRWGQMLRDSATTGRLSLEEEIDAFIRDRQEHVERTILPALRAGKIVIIDRYYFSSMAYQGARGHDPEDIRRRNEAFAPEPDLLLILDAPPETGLERIQRRGDRANEFEAAEALKKTRAIFRSIDKPYSFLLDARQPLVKVRELILRQFAAAYAEAIIRSSGDPTEKLSRLVSLFGA